jgi:DNA polymerase-3 subunit epsilon
MTPWPDLRADRDKAILWARGLTTSSDFVILDSETTGLYEAEMVQLAVIDPAGEVLLDTLLKPGIPIEEGAARIHGITEAAIADAPTFAMILPALTRVLANKRLVIYNAQFDWSIIHRLMIALGAAEIPLPNDLNYPECAMLHYASFFGDWSDYHQSYTYQKLPGGDHSALGDCCATLLLIKKMAVARLSYEGGIARDAVKHAPLLETLHTLNRWRGPTPGSALADFLAMPERTVRYHLRRLEKAGIVERPFGARSGYMVVPQTPVQLALW